MPAVNTCTICSRHDRDRIDAAMRQGTADRALAKLFAVGRTALRNHRTDHVTGLGRDARPNARGGRPAKAPVPADAVPIALDDGAAVIAEYSKLYGETRLLLHQAKAGGDLLRIEKAIGACADVLDRFAQHYGLFKPDAPMINIERMLMVDPNVSDEFLRRYIAAAEAGEPVPELAIGAAGMITAATTIDGEVVA